MWKRGQLKAERTLREDPSAVVFRQSGKLSDTRDCYELLDEIRTDVKGGNSFFVLDLGQVEHLTSCGVGMLAACFTSVANEGGKLCLAAVPERARAVLEVVGLWNVIEVFPSEAEALQAGR